MGTWTEKEPNDLFSAWSYIGETAHVGSGLYYGGGDRNVTISYNLWSQIFISRNTKDEIVIRIDLYSKYGKAWVNVPGEGGYSSYSSAGNIATTAFICNDTSSPEKPKIDHTFGGGGKAGTYYYIMSDKSPSSIKCGVQAQKGDYVYSTLTISSDKIPKRISSCLWVSINGSWKRADIFYSTGSSWKQAIIFDTNHLPPSSSTTT